MSDEKRLVPRIRFPEFTDDWEQRKLGELAIFNPKAELPDVFEYVDLESVVGTEMLSHRTESKRTAPSRAQRLAQTGDLFYQTVRPYQKNNYLFEKSDRNYVFSTGYAQLRPIIDGRFLLCLVQNEGFVKVVLDNCTGTSYPAINSNDLAQIEVCSPNNPQEQEKIGAFFSHLDHLITLHQRKCDTYKKMKKGMMQKFFNQEVRFKKNDGSDYADWVRTPMSDCVASVSVKKKDTVAEIYSVSNVSGFIPQIEQFDGRDNIASTDTKNYKLVSKGQFAYNPSRINVGSLARLDCADLIAVSPLYVVFEITANLDSDYLLNWFDTHEFKKGMRENIEGGVRDSLAFDGLANIAITHPSDIEEQTKIANCLAEFDNLIDASERRLEAYKLLKKAMLQKMFV